MFNFHIVQAEFGDCFIIECGTNTDQKYILIDGGPDTTYEKHLKTELKTISAKGGKLDLIIVSHIHNDHIIGLLDLMDDLIMQKEEELPKTILVEKIWHNTFSQVIGIDIKRRLNKIIDDLGSSAKNMSKTYKASKGIESGQDLTLVADKLDVPINPGFPDEFIKVTEGSNPYILGDLTLNIIGPTEKSLEKLKKEWLKWLKKNEKRARSRRPADIIKADRSIPNLSSIMLLVVVMGKKVLLTGDGLGEHVLKGLKQKKLLNSDNKLKIDILKLPHHGSVRNVSKKFFKKIIADKYLISANGRDDNPDLETLIWIVKTAKKERRNIEIFTTNDTSSLKKLVEEYSPQKYGYHLTIMKKETHSATIKLVD